MIFVPKNNTIVPCFPDAFLYGYFLIFPVFFLNSASNFRMKGGSLLSGILDARIIDPN